MQRRDYPVRFRTSLPSTRQAINDAVSGAMRVARQCGCPGDQQADLEIALREALANAVIHGNAYHRVKRIYLRCYGAPHASLLILVRDEGEGFEPGEVPDPRDRDRVHLDHGRGLFLMRALMDYVEHRKDGREVVLFKTCGNTSG
jgi:serine/threonine-protein kinase RsbW